MATEGENVCRDCSGVELVYTVGHSNHTLEHFVDLLRKHEIQVVADVRSKPFSRFAPQFNREGLANSLRGAGIRYVFLGRELGGLPDGPAFLSEDGHVLYSAIVRTPEFREGMDRLRRGIGKFRVAVMCGEEDPAGCHRHLMLGRVLREAGVEVRHIRGTGEIESDEVVREHSKSSKTTGAVLPGFEHLEDAEWRSIQSVSPRRPPSSSSES